MTYVWKDDLSRERLDGLWKGRDDVEGLDIENEPFISAASQYNNGQYSKLLEVLTQAIDEGHVVFRPHALLLRGSMYSLWRQDKCALDDLNAVLSLPDLPPEMYADVYVKLAAVLAGQSKLNESKQQFDKALNVRNDHVDVYIQRARVLMESDDPNEVLKARDDLEYALRLSPSTPHILYCYGSVYHRAALLTQSMQLLEDAKSKFEEAYQTHPSCVDGLILYSLFLQDIEEVDLSEKILKKGLQLEPDNASIHFSLSILYLLIHQDVGKAKSSLETAIAMDTSCVQAYEALASLKMQEGDYERAEELYQSAVDNSRSLLEMQQAFLSKEIFSTQNQVCREYNIDPVELMAKRIGMGQPPPQH
jgi:tetratricopeptide (TPR) repeat protein